MPDSNDVITESPSALLFLSGADMEPTAIRVAYPGARFVARARLDQASGDGADGAAETWGILIQAPDASPEPAHPVISDDGSPLRAVPVGDGALGGDPAAVLAAAQYWELPPAYVGRLRERAGVAEARAEDEEE